MSQNKIYKVYHEEPNEFRWDYILLPYGEFYEKTACILKALPGDTLRFHAGRDAEIKSVLMIDGEVACNSLCRMRYGIPWAAAFDRWSRYARIEGHGKDVLVKDKCIMVMFTYK